MHMPYIYYFNIINKLSTNSRKRKQFLGKLVSYFKGKEILCVVIYSFSGGIN